MASRHQVLCITKSNRTAPHERITHIGGQNPDGQRWRITEVEAIQAIEADKWEFFVRVSNMEVDVIVASRNGIKYLKTKADGEQPNNLLSLSGVTPV